MDGQTLKAGAQARLQAVRDRLHRLTTEIAEHEAALQALRAQLPELQFEEAAMSFIVEGAPAAFSTKSVERRKLSRPELINLIKEHMRKVGRPLEVGELHQFLEGDAHVDLGSNARNYLCGVLSRSKDTHFINQGKGEWWLAGQDSSN